MPRKSKVSKEPVLISDVVKPVDKPAKQPRRKLSRKTLAIGLGIVLILIGAGLIASLFLIKPKPAPSIISNSIKSAVNFPVYYPDPAKLPAGYTLNLNSFSASSKAVVYSVSYTGGKLVFTVQQKPSDSDISTFYVNQLPLHNNVLTKIGTAAVGAIGKQTVVSLPTNTNAWLIITAPLNINSDQLNQVLQAIVKN